MNNPLNDIDPDLFVCNSNNSCSCFTPSKFNNSFQNNESNFTILHINARSLSRNFDNISDFLSTLSPSFSIIAISETWINGQPIIPYHLSGYTFLHSDRETGRGGGVALFVKDNIKHSRRFDDYNICIDASCEYLLIDCFISVNSKFTVGVMYRKPNSDIDNFFNFYNEVLDKICKGKQNVIITGDFNIDILPENLSNSSDTFININSSYGSQNLIKIPTRITNRSSTLIDNIFSNISNVKCQSGTICTDITDHLQIFSFFKNVNLHNTSQSSPKYFRKITKEGIYSLQKELYNVDWSFLYSLKDVEQMHEAFN